MRFVKMIDEHMAIYDVWLSTEDVEPMGEIAVRLTDSYPPNMNLMWVAYWRVLQTSRRRMEQEESCRRTH